MGRRRDEEDELVTTVGPPSAHGKKRKRPIPDGDGPTMRVTLEPDAIPMPHVSTVPGRAPYEDDDEDDDDSGDDDPTIGLPEDVGEWTDPSQQLPTDPGKLLRPSGIEKPPETEGRRANGVPGSASSLRERPPRAAPGPPGSSTALEIEPSVVARAMAELQDAPPRRVSMLEDPEPDADPEPSAAGTDAPVRPVSILSEPELTAAGPFDEAPRSPIEVTATYAGQDQTRPPPPRARHDSLLARIGTRIPEQTELAQESLHPAQPPQTSASQPNPGPVQAPGPAAPNPWLWRAAIALVLAAIGVVAIAVVISRSS